MAQFGFAEALYKKFIGIALRIFYTYLIHIILRVSLDSWTRREDLRQVATLLTLIVFHSFGSFIIDMDKHSVFVAVLKFHRFVEETFL